MNRELTFPSDTFDGAQVGDEFVALAYLRVVAIKEDLVDVSLLGNQPGSNMAPGERTVTVYCTSVDVREKVA
jgi:hypothetical protein